MKATCAGLSSRRMIRQQFLSILYKNRRSPSSLRPVRLCKYGKQSGQERFQEPFCENWTDPKSAEKLDSDSVSSVALLSFFILGKSLRPSIFVSLFFLPEL